MNGSGADLETLFTAHLRALESRLAAALESEGYGSLIVHSGSPVGIFRDDQHYSYRVHAPFKRWAPVVNAPDSFIVLEPGRRPVLLLHRPADYWHKPADLPTGYWARQFDIKSVANLSEVRSLRPLRLDRAAYIGDALAELASWNLVAVNPEKLLTRLDYERAIKTPYEIECLRMASRIGAQGHLAAAERFYAGGSEFDVYFDYLRACNAREQELPYNPIVALNENAAVLHYQVLGRQPPEQRHSFLIDAGAEFAGYASDITRTYSYQDPDFAALVGKLDEMQQSLCSSVHAGVDWRDVHLSAHRMTAELLHEAEILHCDADEAVDAGLTSVFLPHGLGHLLGLQVHDVGGRMQSPLGGEIAPPEGHPYLRLTRVLEPGFVITMEPGIYFIDMLLEEARADSRSRLFNWPRIESLRKFGGIRIEDDLVVTAGGHENLTREAFRRLRADP
jgi:Xaa-Pro dipeptidase